MISYSVRLATIEDAQSIAGLLNGLGHEASSDEVHRGL